MGKNTWKAVGGAHEKSVASKNSKAIDWMAEKDARPRSHTKSVHISYRYSVSLIKGK